MTALLALLGNMPGEVCRDPHLLYKLTSPRFSGELPLWFFVFFIAGNLLYFILWRFSLSWLGISMGYKSTAALAPNMLLQNFYGLIKGNFGKILLLTFDMSSVWIGTLLIVVAVTLKIYTRRFHGFLWPAGYKRILIVALAIIVCLYPILIDGQMRTGIGLITSFYFLVFWAILFLWDRMKLYLPAYLGKLLLLSLISLFFFYEVYRAGLVYQESYKFAGGRNQFIQSILLHENVEKYKKIAVIRDSDIYYQHPVYSYSEVYLALTAIGFNPQKWQIDLIKELPSPLPSDTLVIDMNEFQQMYIKQNALRSFDNLGIFPQKTSSIEPAIARLRSGKWKKVTLFSTFTLVVILSALILRHWSKTTSRE